MSAPAFDPDRLDKRDPTLIERVLPAARAFARHYLRLRVDGAERLGRAPVLYVSNHNGGLAGPDIACTLVTLWEALGPSHPVYALAHDFAMRHFTPFGAALQRFGGLRACPANATAALERGAQVLVYPGGDLEAYRTTARRNEIILGERVGFVRVAQQTGVPIVPIVAHGAHRSAYILTDGERIARRIGLKRWARLARFPVALSLPWGIAIGPWAPYLPLPFRVRLRVLPPIAAPIDADPAAVREEVRASMQAALDDMASTRTK